MTETPTNHSLNPIQTEHRITVAETKITAHEETHRVLQTVLEDRADRQREKQEAENKIREELREGERKYTPKGETDELRRRVETIERTSVTADKYETQSQAGADAIAAIGREVDRRLGLVETKQANMDGRMAVYGAVAALVASGIASLIIYAVTK